MVETDQVRIARITAKQAIVVAPITSLAGLLGAAIRKYGFGDSAESVASVQQDAVQCRGHRAGRHPGIASRNSSARKKER